MDLMVSGQFKPPLNTHSDISSGARDIAFCQSLPEFPFFVQETRALLPLCICAGLSEPFLLAKVISSKSCVLAHMCSCKAKNNNNKASHLRLWCYDNKKIAENA